MKGSRREKRAETAKCEVASRSFGRETKDSHGKCCKFTVFIVNFPNSNCTQNLSGGFIAFNRSEAHAQRPCLLFHIFRDRNQFEIIDH
jgi:hypothetical protein